MTDRSINVKVAGNADLSKLEQAMLRAEARAKSLRREFEETGGAITKMGRMGEQLERMSKSGISNMINLAAGGLSGGAMYGKISGGLNQYKQHLVMLDEEARTVKRLGEAYRDYHRAVVDSGRAYGYSNQEVIGLSSMLARTRGRAGAGQLMGDMRTVQGFGRGYGMGATEAGGYFSGAVRSGMIGKGGDMSDMRQFAAMISDAVVAGGMQGREAEVITSLQRLSGAINSKIVGVQGTQVAGEALATMNATGIRGLQGDAGAALLERVNQAIMQPGGGEAGDLFMYRALGGGGSKGKGMNLADFRYLQEEGMGGITPSGKSSFQSLMEATTQTGLGGRYGLMAMNQLTGMSMHQIESLQQTFMPQGQFQTEKFGALQGALGTEGMKKVDPSVWGLVAELAQGGDVGAVGREFEQLAPGQQAAGTKDELLAQIKQYGTDHVAMSQGQIQEQLDNDLAKAAEDAGSKLLELSNAATTLATKFLEMGGQLPGPLGAIAPIAAASAAGSAMSAGSQWGLSKLFGAGAKLFGGGAAAAAPAVAGGEAAAGGTIAAGGGLGGTLAAAAAPVAAGLAMGTGAAYVGSEISEHVYGTQGFGAALAQAGSNAVNLPGNVASGQVGYGDYMNALGAMGMAVPGVLAGTALGISSAATGGDFQEGYKTGFFNVNTFDSAGRQQWQAGQGPNQMNSQPGGSWGGAGGGGGWGGSPDSSAGSPLEALGGDDQQLAAKVDSILKGTGMEGKGSLMIALSKKYGVPVELALAQAQKEDQFNTVGSSVENNNPYNLRYTGNWGDDRPGKGGFAHFPSVAAGIEGYFRLLGGAYQTQLSKGIETGDWSALVNRFAPPSENNSKQYSDQMNAWTQQYHQRLMPSSRGGWWDVGADDSPALLHKREMVLPAGLAEELRASIRSPGINADEARTAAGQISIKIDPIVVQLPGGISTTVQATGRHNPFSGVVDHPTGKIQ